MWITHNPMPRRGIAATPMEGPGAETMGQPYRSSACAYRAYPRDGQSRFLEDDYSEFSGKHQKAVPP